MSLKIMQQEFLWKRFYDASIESYVGVENEPILDMRADVNTIRICDGVTPGGHPISGYSTVDPEEPPVIVARINTPAITSPINNAVDTVLLPIITSSAFSGIKADGSPDTHASSQWQISNVATFATVLFDTGFAVNRLTSHDTSTANIGTLVAGTIYYVRVKYKGASGLESDWSTVVKFTTAIALPETLAFRSNGDQLNGARLGEAVAISRDGNTAVVGANEGSGGDSNKGKIYIYAKVNNNWSLQAGIRPATLTTSMTFGKSVAISDDGNKVVVGVPRWSYSAGGTIYGGGFYVFKRNGTTWTEEAAVQIKAGALGYGNNVSISGDGLTIAVHGFGASGTIPVKIYKYIASVWTIDYTSTGTDDYTSIDFGSYLSFDGNELISPTQTAVHRYVRQAANSWTKSVVLTAVGAINSFAASFNAEYIAIGVPTYSNNRGSVVVYKRNGNAWAQHADPISGRDIYAHAGMDVAINDNGTTVVVGHLGISGVGGLADKGYVTVHNLVNSAWQLIRTINPLDSERVDDDKFGHKLDLSGPGDTLIVGAYWQTVASVHCGSVYLYD